MKSVIITIDEKEIEHLSTITNSLVSCGLQVTNEFGFGVITGNADDSTIEKIKAHKEVISLKEDQPIHLSPPDSPIQ